MPGPGGAMMSKTGNPQVYEDGDQRNAPDVESQQDRLEGGQKNAHDLFDPKDNRTLANRRQQEEKMESEQADHAKTVTDPLEPARKNGNKPSRGAEIDAELQREDEEALQKKGAWGPSV